MCTRKLIDEREINKPKHKIGESVRGADLKKTFSKVNSANLSYILYEIAENKIDSIPSYKIDQLRERYKEASLKKTEFLKKMIVSWKNWISLRSNQKVFVRHYFY